MDGFIFFGDVAINPNYVAALVGLGETTKIIMVNGEGVEVQGSVRTVAERIVMVTPH